MGNLAVKFTGAVGNAGGQTVVFKIQKNGVDVPGLTTGPIPTTTGAQSAQISLADASAVRYAAGDVFTAILTPSAPLTTALADVMVGCS